MKLVEVRLSQEKSPYFGLEKSSLSIHLGKLFSRICEEDHKQGKQ